MKNLKNLGKALSKAEQKEINGGGPCRKRVYAFCDPSGNNNPPCTICVN